MAAILQPFDQPRSERRPSAHMSDLSERFNNHTLNDESYSNTCQLQDYSFHPSVQSPTIEFSQPFPTLQPEQSPTRSIEQRRYSHTSTATIRRQRQRAIRHQCSSSHLLEVKNLIARLVANGEIPEATTSISSGTSRTSSVSHGSSSTGSMHHDGAASSVAPKPVSTKETNRICKPSRRQKTKR